jgi:hypothetical protein
VLGLPLLSVKDVSVAGFSSQSLLNITEIFAGHQPFCFLHLSAHQQELAIQMEGIIGDHDLLREELNKPRIYSQEDMPNFVHEFSLIDAWQTHTLAQVTKVVTQEADRARNVIRTIMDENQRRATSNTVAITEEFERLKKRLAMLSEQLQERMKTSEYLEPDLRQWQNQLTDIKKCSVTPRVCTDAIVNKLIVRETRQININVSNILDINYEDAERSKASNNEKKTNSLGGTAKTKVTERYNSTTYRDEGAC